MEQSLAVKVGQGYQLTQEALHCLDYGPTLSNPCSVLEPRHALPLVDRSSWEMLVALSDDGWKWQHAESKQSLLPYSAGREKVFYSSGVRVMKSYMMCLLRAEELSSSFGVRAIPHLASDKNYAELLKGNEIRQSRRVILDADMAVVCDDEAPVPGVVEDVVPDGGEGDDVFDEDDS